MSGKKIRMKRIFKEDGNSVISALDFGAFNGNVKGLENPEKIVQEVIDGGVDALIMSPGFAKSTAHIYGGKVASIIRVTGGVSKFGPDGLDHRLMCTVEEAVALGADAVMNMIFMGSSKEAEMFELMRDLSEKCRKYGIVLFTEVLPADFNNQFNWEWIDSAIRIAYEFGADAVKTYISNEKYDEIIKHIPVPVVMAGGPKESNIFENTQKAIDAGAKGVAIGRNIFQDENPRKVVDELVKIVHKGDSDVSSNL